MTRRSEMKHTKLFVLILMLVVALQLAACGPKAAATTEKISPSTLEEIEGSELKRVILTEKAAERIGVQTVPASEMEVPYAAVIYDTAGNTWLYTSPAPRTVV